MAVKNPYKNLASLSFSNFFRSGGVGACAELAEVLLFPLLEKVENKVNDTNILILIKLSCKKYKYLFIKLL